MASILKVDDLRGNTAAGNITVTDGSATMQLQRGVVKCFLSGDFSGGVTTNILDSLNISSVTDYSTGQYYPINWTNAFTAADYAGTSSNGSDVLTNTTCNWGAYTTSGSGIGSYKLISGAAYADKDISAIWTGDLA